MSDKDDYISRRDAIDALHTWFRDGFDEDKWWNSTHVLAAIEGLPSAQQGYKWETCFECPLSHGCPKIKGCTNGQAIEYASQMPNDCPLSVQPEPHWIPCSEKLPSETVIATVETKVFKHRYVCEAVWIPRWIWKASFDFKWEDCLEYKEDDDEYYVLEGWYERVHNWDEYAYVAIDDNVIAWMPIPIPYCGGNEE